MIYVGQRDCVLGFGSSLCVCMYSDETRGPKKFTLSCCGGSPDFVYLYLKKADFAVSLGSSKRSADREPLLSRVYSLRYIGALTVVSPVICYVCLCVLSVLSGDKTCEIEDHYGHDTVVEPRNFGVIV